MPVGVNNRLSFYDSSEGQIGIKVVLGAEERRVEVEVVVLERVHELVNERLLLIPVEVLQPDPLLFGDDPERLLTGAGRSPARGPRTNP